MDDFLLIIDGSSLLSTQFYGNLPPAVLAAKTPEEKEKHFHRIMQTSTGRYTNAVFGFLRALLKIIEVQKPTHLAVTWDLTRDTFRRELYEEYKANRTEVLLPLKEQFALCQEVLFKIGIKQYMSLKYEADDFSGSLNKTFSNQIPIRIMTKDHDYLQLAGDNTTIWLLHSTQSKADELFAKYRMKKEAETCPEKTFPLTPELIRKEYGIWPESVPSLKGLQGDASDNIKGVPGIGQQTATALIGHYGTVSALYEAIHNAGENGLKELAAFWKEELGIKRNPMNYLCKESDTELVGEKAAFLSERLATIYNDIPIEDSLDALEMRIDWDSLRQVLHELEITTISLPNATSTSQEEMFEVQRIADLGEAEELFLKLQSLDIPLGLAYDKEQELVYLSNGEKDVYAVCFENFITMDFVSERLYGLCEKRKLGCFFIRNHANLFPRYHKNLIDVSLIDYLLRPLSAHHDATNVAMEWCSSTVDSGDFASIARIAAKLTTLLLDKLELSSCANVFYDIEQPLTWVLLSMEREGVRVDLEQLKAFSVTLNEMCEKEEKLIYELAGEQFNINSPKQLGEILFVKLAIPTKKKTKSGFSTSADVLEDLRERYPIVEHVLQYRHFSKLYSTYAEGLQSCVEEDGRIHTTFQQMVTATGRLSSTNPNLQNIPTRTELGRMLRKVFVPSEGCTFVDADYSQIELRLMAHMSGDSTLIGAYQNAADIHRLTASQVFGIPYDEVTKEQRGAAKAVNFGILYGISSFSLSQDLGITNKMAAEYIQRYFAKYPSIKQYLDKLISDARQEGHATTLYGRIRPIPEIASANFVQRSFGERAAMNSPIQGTAADIMKIAMLRVHKQLEARGLKTKMLLQVHDELLLEAPNEEVAVVKELLKDAMEHAAELSVPLDVEVCVGSSWYDAK